FSSAYGSTAADGCSSRGGWGAPARTIGASAPASPFWGVDCPLIRSWSPIAASYAFAATVRWRQLLRLDSRGSAGWRDFAISPTAREKPALVSDTTAGLPRFTASGTARSLGTS